MVIGRNARDVKAADAVGYVAGYTVYNVNAVRDCLENWYRGAISRDCDTVLGPWLVLACKVPDPHALGLRTRINGQITQHGNPAHMISDVPALIEYLSSFMTLRPGDEILTGPPDGVVKVSAGEKMVCEIDGTGQTIRQADQQLAPRATDNFTCFAEICARVDGHTYFTPTHLDHTLFHPFGMYADQLVERALHDCHLEDRTLPGLWQQRGAEVLNFTDEAGRPDFPTGSRRVLAYPAPHFAVAYGGGWPGSRLRRRLRLRLPPPAQGPRPSRIATACGALGPRGGPGWVCDAARSATRAGLVAPFLRSLRLTRRMHGRRCVTNLFAVRRGVGL